MANALDDVQNTYLTLDAKYTKLRKACKTQTQKDMLAKQYSDAQLAYNKTINKMLSDDDADVAKLDVQLRAANDAVIKSTGQLDNISKVLDDITNAVTIGAKLVSIAGL